MDGKTETERFHLAVSAADLGIWDLDIGSGGLLLSALWWHQLGEPPQPTGCLDGWLARVHPDDRDRLRAAILPGATEHGLIDCEYRALHRDGSWRFMRCRGYLMSATGEVGARAVGVQLDVTAQKASEERLRSSALHDPLTGLANQVLFREQLAQTLRKRERPHAIVVLFLDLDRFKNVNDSLGHQAGDQLLVAFAARLITVLRVGDTFARLGGDEFAILLDDVDAATQVSLVADRIRGALKRPFAIDGSEVFVAASIGISVADPSRDVDAEELLREADTAMYRAKAAGKGRYAFFDQAMHTSVSRALRLETDLQHAMDRREFKVFYQPIIALGSGRLVGFEALLRWPSPRRGWVSPAEFIPVAEETGAIVPLGNWVLRKACAQLAAWRRSISTARTLSVSVNVSSRQLFGSDLAADVADALACTQLPPSCLRLEVTESTFIDDLDRASEVLDRIKALRVALALDDFGTGYSSLRSLHRLRFDVLKIDKSFVAELDQPATVGIVQAIVALAGELGMSTVAEGVESAAQAALLRRLRCGFGQGYHYARPWDATTISRMLVEHRSQHMITLPKTEGGAAAEPESAPPSVIPVEITCPIHISQAAPAGAFPHVGAK